MNARIRATVIAVAVDPLLRDPLRRHLVDIRVDEVLDGEIPTPNLRMLVHSPSKVFRDPEPAGEQFDLRLTGPEPAADGLFLGEVAIERA